MILIGMISVTVHASAQHLVEGANMGPHGAHALPQLMQRVVMSATHGQYIPSNASNTTGEPGAIGLILGLTLVAMIYFTLNGRTLFKSARRSSMPASGPYAGPDASRIGETSSPNYAASHLSWNSPSSAQIVSNGN